MIVVGPEHALAQLAASIAFADGAPVPSRIQLFADPEVASGAPPVAAPLAEIVLAKPCGTLGPTGLTLHAANPAGAMVVISGTPRAARWETGDGKLVGAGTVTDMDHAGDFRIAGAPTLPGDDSPSLYAGGLVLLGEVVLN